jgi:hypothetical protein
VRDEIHLEDDSPPMVQYSTIDNQKIDSFDLPPDHLDGFIRPVISSVVTVSFPLVELLCRQIFSDSDSEG